MPGARHFSELVVWQLADELRVKTFELTARASFARNRRLREEVEDAMNSVCHNIAEGFGGTNREFISFLRYARRSLNEVQDGLRAALLRGHIQAADMVPVRKLLNRLYPAIAGLMAHLRNSRDDSR